MMALDSDQILARLQSLHPKSIDLSLGRLERLLNALGHPERQLPPVVHIAGTNGKGSTLAMLDAMLSADGRRVQRYISPHLERFAERILLAGEPVDERVLARVLEHTERANQGEPITFFEITTAAAFLIFAEYDADVLLLETGLGGRLDATNVVDHPRLTLITPVSMDHQAFLGDKLELIAGEKAGILKPSVPAVIGRQEPLALKAIERRANELEAPLMLHGRDWEAEQVGDKLKVRLADQVLSLPLPALEGKHQIDNAGQAVTAASWLGNLSPSENALAQGLKKTHWPARLQRLTAGPFASLLPNGSTLWLDGGHNPAAGQALKSYFNATDKRPLHLIVGMINTKDSKGFLQAIAPLATDLRAVSVPGEQASRAPEDIVREANDLGLPAMAERDVPSALIAIANQSISPVRVLICGSLYLAGRVLRANS